MSVRLLPLLAVLAAGCAPDMGVQPRYDAYEASDFFADGAAMRPLPAHTIARGQPDTRDTLHTGLANGLLVADFRQPVTRELLLRGREQYQVFCAVCHGLTGAGDGMIVQRGFPAPPTFHSDRLRGAPVGHFVQVIADGYGLMYPYASRVPAEDRWAVVAYIRALQLSQHATPDDVPPDELRRLEGEAP